MSRSSESLWTTLAVFNIWQVDPETTGKILNCIKILGLHLCSFDCKLLMPLNQERSLIHILTEPILTLLINPGKILTLGIRVQNVVCARKGSGLVLGQSSGCQNCAESQLHCPMLDFTGSCSRTLSLFRQWQINCLWQVSLKDRKTIKEHFLGFPDRGRIMNWSLGALLQLS